MELKYHGGNCIVIERKKETVVIDGALKSLGLKDATAKNAIYIATQPDLNPAVDEGVMVDCPGEYEIKDVSVKGIATKRMIDYNDDKKTTVYRIVIDGLTFAVIGHAAVPLDDDILEEIGMVDIVLIPVGGGGYTLDAHQAATIVRQMEPKIVVPTHYADNAIKYEVPQNELEEFIKEMGSEHETVASYKIKNGILPIAPLTVVEISRSS